jgi:tetratricopeptide (TPR) repeat protein
LPDNSIEKIVARADELYSQRADSKNVWTNVELLRSALDEVNNYEIAWRLGRAFFFLGQEAPAAETKRELHAQGVGAGKRAVRAKPESVEGHFWLGVNLALLAQVEGPIKAIACALQAKRALKQAVVIDAAYHAAGPLRALARLQHKLPRLLGGGIARAHENYERAIELAPNNTVTRIYFAELLLEIGDANRARAELEAVMDAPFDPAWAFEIERDRKIARELLKID